MFILNISLSQSDIQHDQDIPVLPTREEINRTHPWALFCLLAANDGSMLGGFYDPAEEIICKNGMFWHERYDRHGRLISSGWERPPEYIEPKEVAVSPRFKVRRMGI